MKYDKKIIYGLILFTAVLIVVLYFLFSLGLIRYFTDRVVLSRMLREKGADAAYMFIGLQILQVIAAPVPGELTGFAGGIFFGTFRGIVYSTAGLTIGSWTAFVLARIAGRPLVEKIVNPETIKRYDYVMEHRGSFMAFLMFLIPGFPKDILCYILGLGHMSHGHFILVSTAGRLLGTVMLTVQGDFLRNEQYAAFFTILAASIVLILLVMVFRTGIERGFRGMRAAQRLKARAARLKQKNRAAG